MANSTFLPKYKDAQFNLGPDQLAEHRPELTRLIGEVIIAWPFVEHDLALTLGQLLGSTSHASLAVFTALRGFRSQKDVLEAAAKVALSPCAADVVSAALAALWQYQKTRDKIAHGLWGPLAGHEDKAVYLPSNDYAPWNAEILTEDSRVTFDDLMLKMHVYSRDDLAATAQEMREARDISFNLMLYCTSREGLPREPEAARDRLLSWPRVRQSLAHLKERQNRT